MAKSSTEYVCQECGAIHPKWTGKCDSCDAWNSILAQANTKMTPKGLGTKPGRLIGFFDLKGRETSLNRRISSISEFDRVTGGGLVPGSAVLIGGDPGIGKSTLLLQVAASLAKHHTCFFISGEESVDQIRLSARRLDLEKANVQLASATNVRDIVETLNNNNSIDVVVIDSIQTMYLDNLDAAPGTVSQVRSSVQELVQLAKLRGFSILLVGHVTKEGTIAGPRVVEHLVDTVLYFEGDRGQQFRILRAVKNRFGATDEIGVFEMMERGLSEVTNPSSFFLTEREKQIPGTSIFASLEGNRPVLVEIQALVTPSKLSSPRRAVVGWDANRLAMVMAVLDARCSLSLTSNDIYLNVAGGFKISEPAADLAAAAALISSHSRTSLQPGIIFFGEIGLSGEIRAVPRANLRLKEATKLGFSQAFIPGSKKTEGMGSQNLNIKLNYVNYLSDLINLYRDETAINKVAIA